MSKYVIELRPDCKIVQQICEKDGQIYVDSTGVHYLDQFTIDYIKENCKSLMDAFYQKGFEDGKKAFDLLDAERDSEYQKGLDDAWEAAKKIALMDTETSENVTGYFGLFRIMDNLTAAEAIEKLKAYEEKQKIEVKDEVIWTKDENVVIFVTSVYTDDNNMEWCDGVTKDGKAYSILTKNARKTGRHFDIENILEAMKS